MKRWYAVQTQPRKERLAEHHLNNQDLETFFPTQRRLRKIGRHRHTVFEAFFTNYLFVTFDIERERWRSVNGTIGVSRLVTFGSAQSSLPAPLPTGLIERLIELSSDDGEVRFDDPLAAGARVRVVGGPFDSLCGTLQIVGDKDRVTILLDILSSVTRVTMTRHQLVAA